MDENQPVEYREGQDALKKYEDMTFSVEEIDAFLPDELKKSKKRNAIPAVNAPSIQR